MATMPTMRWYPISGSPEATLHPRYCFDFAVSQRSDIMRTHGQRRPSSAYPSLRVTFSSEFESGHESANTGLPNRLEILIFRRERYSPFERKTLLRPKD
jgi:hypothetical protein